jgi:hypothetical protein
MSPELARAVLTGRAPFNGVTCVFSDISLDALWRCYRAAVECLTIDGPDAIYWQVDDWHWHDGYVTNETPLTGQEWQSWTESKEALAAAWQTEDYVHRGVYPSGLSWYLRFHLWESSLRSGGSMDFSGGADLVARVLAAVEAIGIRPSEVRPSLAWFAKTGDLSVPQNSVLGHLPESAEFERLEQVGAFLWPTSSGWSAQVGLYRVDLENTTVGGVLRHSVDAWSTAKKADVLPGENLAAGDGHLTRSEFLEVVRRYADKGH